MPWLQLCFTVEKAQCEYIEQLLFAEGAQSVTLLDAQDEPQYEPALGETPLWSLMTLSALFAEQTNTQALLKQLNNNSLYPLPACQVEFIADKDWEREWMERYQPIKMGQCLWICPSWLQAPEPNAINLILDPGLAFGTGTHPTTALCLEWLDQQAYTGQLTGKKIVDYGCGSGILAIGALLLGAQSAIAIDHDPQAISATKDNALKNSITDKQLCTVLTSEEPAELAADIVVANILAQPLIHLHERFIKLCKTGDKLILSGILETQQELIVDKYKKNFYIKKISRKDAWLRIDCEKK